MNGNEKTVGELKKFLDDFDDSAPIGIIMIPWGGLVTRWYQMQDLENDGIENPSPIPYPTLCVEAPEGLTQETILEGALALLEEFEQPHLTEIYDETRECLIDKGLIVG